MGVSSPALALALAGSPGTAIVPLLPTATVAVAKPDGSLRSKGSVTLDVITTFLLASCIGLGLCHSKGCCSNCDLLETPSSLP